MTDLLTRPELAPPPLAITTEYPELAHASSAPGDVPPIRAPESSMAITDEHPRPEFADVPSDLASVPTMPTVLRTYWAMAQAWGSRLGAAMIRNNRPPVSAPVPLVEVVVVSLEDEGVYPLKEGWVEEAIGRVAPWVAKMISAAETWEAELRSAGVIRDVQPEPLRYTPLGDADPTPWDPIDLAYVEQRVAAIRYNLDQAIGRGDVRDALVLGNEEQVWLRRAAALRPEVVVV